MGQYTKIPKRIQVGGVVYPIIEVERVENNAMGESLMVRGDIRIASKVNRDDKQSDEQKYNTFWHELVHTILGTMGNERLNRNEEFVCTFSSFLCEATKNCYFKEEE